MPARPRAIATLVLAVVLVAVRPALAAADPLLGSPGPAPAPAAAAPSTVPTAVDAPDPQADPGPPVVAGPTPVAVVPTSRALRAADASAAPGTAADAVAPLCGGTGADGRRVQAVYAYAGAQPDQTALDFISATAIPEVDRTYQDSAARTGGNRQVRWVTTSGTSGCQVSIRSLRITSGVTDFDSLKADLVAQGLTDTSRKYLVWTEGQLDTPQTLGCGLGEFWNDDTPGPTNYNATNAGGFSAAFAAVDGRCWNLNGGHSVPAHELMHMLGAVQQSAPHSSSFAEPYTGHCVDDYDAMCYGSGPLTPVAGCTDPAQERLFDCNNDDYFHTDPVAGSYLCTHWDTATNPFLWYSNVLQPPRPVPSLTLVPGAGSVSVSWTASPSCVPPDSYVVTVTGSSPVTVAGTATSVVRAAPPGPVTVTVTPSRSGVTGTPSSATTTVTSSTSTTTATTTPPPPPTVPVQAPNRLPVGEVLLSNVNRRDFALFGWAVDPDTAAPVTVRIDLQGIGTTYVRADANWDGVQQRLPGYGNAHAFLFSRSNMPPGKRDYCAWAVDAQTGGFTALGCRQIVVK